MRKNAFFTSRLKLRILFRENITSEASFFVKITQINSEVRRLISKSSETWIFNLVVVFLEVLFWSHNLPKTGEFLRKRTINWSIARICDSELYKSNGSQWKFPLTLETILVHYPAGQVCHALCGSRLAPSPDQRSCM